MSRVVIWGTGKTAAKALHSIKQDVEIVGYPDHYYYHINHLNAVGAKAFTKRLEQDILW